MKIALFLPSLHGGGAEKVFLLLGKTFIEQKHAVDMILMVKKGQYLSEVPNTIRLISLECPHLWTSGPALIRYIRRERPDVLLSAMPLANGLAVWSTLLSRVSTRVFISEHNAFSLTFGAVTVPRHRILYWIIRSAYPFADGMVAVSDGVAARLKAIPRVRPEKVHRIYNPVDAVEVEQKASQPLQHPWFQDHEVPIILSVGRLVKQKDFPTLIRAFAEVRKQRHTRLIILGHGAEYELIAQMIQKLNLSNDVEMTGFIANPYTFMARASVLVLSSVQEGFGNVLVEAMACGTSVVATDSPGPREILDNGRFGPLVPIGDVEALAKSIHNMLDKPTPPDVLKARARHFSLEGAADRYLRMLRGSDA